MKLYITNTRTMSKKSGILTALATATVLTTAPVSAETPNNEVNKQVLQVKQACKTSLGCARLSNSIQNQIDELKSKGLRNLSKKERIKFGQLRRQLITAKNSQLEDENNKQVQQVKIIATEKAETQAKTQKTDNNYKLIATERAETQEKLTKVSERLDSIEGSLL